jgi:hypothetical protein
MGQLKCLTKSWIVIRLMDAGSWPRVGLVNWRREWSAGILARLSAKREQTS